MSLDPRRVKTLFGQALDHADPADRLAFLDRVCGDDHALRQRLDELLMAHDNPASAMEPPLGFVPEAGNPVDPAVDVSTDAYPTKPPTDTSALPDWAQPPSVWPKVVAPETVAPEPPTAPADGLIAGRYRIRQEIGEGGMGSVYLAEQVQPVKRKVALKLIKSGMDSKTVLARFETERQALALMDHPNIAKVLDAGTTEQGRPFFVMELVKGVPLTDYCDQHRLGLPERLALFRQICSAVHHAHQKGIIHRDLKPMNILVEDHDAHPVPKVIDFGLAKATSGMQLGEHSVFSAFGSVAGTLLYMAPEQATLNALDVDTRADIYALGVILYELITGSTPIAKEALKRSAWDEMLRVVREVVPPTPSSRISTSESLPNLAAARQTEPARLSRFVRGDLDWIVMKALAKERHRRYESAVAFAQDVERFINHEPVSAGPPTAAYRVGKFVRRNRLQVVAASLVLLALVGGIIGTTLGLFEADRQKKKAIVAATEQGKARQAEALQRQRADEKSRQAEKRLAQIEKINDILGSIFRDLNPRNDEKDSKPLAALLGERLDHATSQIEGEAIGDPLAVARLQMTLGRSQLGLGHPEKAIELFSKARNTFIQILGHSNADTLISISNLAGAYEDAGRLDFSIPLFEEAVEHMKATLGLGHPDTLSSMNNLALAYRAAGKSDRVSVLHEEVLSIQRAKLGPDHPDTLISMSNLASAYADAGRLDLALPLLEEVLKLEKNLFGADHPNTLISKNNLALGYQNAGKLDLALPIFEETLGFLKKKLGDDHPDTLVGMSNLAVAYDDAGRADRALPLYGEVLAKRKAKLGPDHPDTLISMSNLASAYNAVGKTDLALQCYRETLALMRSKMGDHHLDTLTCMNNMSMAYLDAGMIDQALPLVEEVAARRKSRLGIDHPSTLTSMNNLALCYRSAKKLDLAFPVYEEVLARQKVKLGVDHPSTLRSMSNLAVAYDDAGRVDRALPLYEEVLAKRKAKLGPGHPDTLRSLNNLAGAYRDAGQSERAQALLLRHAEVQSSEIGSNAP